MANISQTRSEVIFQEQGLRRINKSMFDLSHERKITFNMGELIPVCCYETLPGDEWSLGTEVMTRFNPLIFPIMSRINMRLWYFYIPIRIIWTNFTSFISDYATSLQQNNHPTLIVPYVSLGFAANGVVSLFHYLGFPGPTTGDSLKAATSATFSALPYAAYLKIYYDFFVNPLVQGYEEIKLTDGDNTSDQWYTGNPTGLTTQFGGVKHRNWNKDFFTSATALPQSGTGIKMPMFDTAGSFPDGTDLLGPYQMKPWDGTTPGTAGLSLTSDSGTTGVILDVGESDPAFLDIQGTAATIAQFRYASSLQELLERMNRSGNRYTDVMRIVFGTDPLAGIVDFVQYLGSNSSVVQITDVMSTADTSTGVVVGDYAGKAMGHLGGNTIKHYCKEHGFIIGIINIQPRSSYMQGIHKMWNRSTWFDYALADFANIGDQAIERREFVFDWDEDYAHADQTQTWGYIPMYSEYRYHNDIVAGQFREDEFTDWHLTRMFDMTTIPGLNGEFLKAKDIRTDDIFVKADSDPDVYAYIWNKAFAWRPLPKYGIPGM